MYWGREPAACPLVRGELRVGEMTQKFRALVLEQVRCLGPSTHKVALSHLYSSFRMSVFF